MMIPASGIQFGACQIATAMCFLAVFTASGCETMSSSSVPQPSRVIVMQPNSSDFKQIKAYLEAALAAQEQGDRETFLSGMESVRKSADKFLGHSSKYKVSDETVYQFLADRLKDAPGYLKPYSAAMLSKLENRARSGQKILQSVRSGDDSDINAMLNPDVLRAELESMLADWGETAFSADDALVRHVGYFVKYFALCDTEKTNRTLERSRKYMPFVRDVFSAQNLHEDIAFAVPFVESRFTTSACSVAGALGMFQFMPRTARDYGMQVASGWPAIGSEKDDRLDWQKEANAAARYLVKSRNVFGSSVLALGAYHHGSMKVVQVLLAVAERSKVRSFSPIFNDGELEPYSREYIPQCLAAACIYRYVKQARIDRLPPTGVHYENVSEPVSIAKLTLRHKDLLAQNQDLINAERIYCYASTGGYALITDSSEAIRSAGKKSAAEENTLSNSPSPAVGQEYACPPAATRDAKKDQPDADAPSASEQNMPNCSILYTFQKANSLGELARTFGVDLHTILAHPMNKRFKDRYPLNPKPGDLVVIPQLAPTTTILSSEQAATGADYRFYTAQNQTLQEIAQSVSDAFEGSGGGNVQAGTNEGNVTPELILYWNRDHLPPGVGMEEPLPAGIPLFIIADFRRGYPPQTSTSQARK